MKIAMIGLRGIPAMSGGVETAVENLAPLLKADVTVYCRTPYYKTKPKQYKGVKLVYLPTINTKYTEALVHTFLSTIHVLFTKADIVHYHALGNAIFSFIPRLFGKKTVVTIHGLDYEREKWGVIAKIYLRLCEKLMFPNKIIAVSKKIQRRLRAIYIPNGVNFEKPIKKQGNYILSLGRIVPEKGLHFLVEAFKKTNTNVKLVIAGGSSHTDKYESELRKLANDKRIIFTGPLYGKKKIEAYSNARFFVLPSTIEGMPIVLLEAMSFGLCPLTSDIEENMEVNRHGFSFKSKDVNDLKAKLEYMLKNRSLVSKKGKKCQELVKKTYRWETVAKKTMDVYRKISLK